MTTATKGEAIGLRLAIEREFDYASLSYRKLFEQSDADAFRHPIWLEAFGRHLVHDRGAMLLALTIRDPEGRLLALVPLVSRRLQGVRLLETADLGVSDYAAPVIDASARTMLAAEPDLRARIEALLPPHDIFRLRPIRPEALADWSLFFKARAVPLDFSAHEARIIGSFDRWREQAMTASHRRYVDRRIKRLEKSGPTFLVKAESQDAAASIAEIRHLRTDRFVGDMVQNDAVERFYAAVATNGISEGFARVYHLVLEDIVIGRVFALTHRNRLLYLLIGCDYERYGRHSPGLVLYDKIMRDWSTVNDGVFDFTIGDEPFKADWGTVRIPMWMLIETPTLRGRAAMAAFTARERMRGLREALERRIRTYRMKAGDAGHA